ncbi:PocR ligand-binding domain-containing protein [uncultured Desulfosarcina sp.]|uniref:PocR ligand-binding domain-containing protein n=1 Tax=uncultured Desulfosarcina sp. TaxID=218289 RepID=UPI0029C9124C|nr:PocR ligand-binding domain-containing protein [uncultured Desulfosarcina sp.]
MDALFKEMSDIRFQDLIDLSALQNLTTSFSRLTGLATAILDLEGNVLSFSGWQEICLEFHRKNPITAKRCLESDTILAGNLAKGNHFNVYKCKNGLVDVAVPITIENIHTGNLFIGQFLFEPPDTATFAQQADQFGFDKKWYLDALSKVPIISTENLDQAIDFLKNLTTLIGSSGYDRKKLIELNKDLEFRIQERTAELAYSNEQLRVLSEASFEGIIISENLLIVEANGIMAKMFGFAKETELVGVKFTDLVSEEKRSDVNDKMVSGYDRPYETLGLKKDGAAFPIQVHGKTFVYN